MNRKKMKILCTKLAEPKTERLLVDTQGDHGCVLSQPAGNNGISVLEEVVKSKPTHEIKSAWKFELYHRKLGLHWKFRPASVQKNKHRYGERESELGKKVNAEGQTDEREVPHRIRGWQTFHSLSLLVVFLLCLLICYLSVL